MLTKRLFVFIHIRNKGEVGYRRTCLSPPVKRSLHSSFFAINMEFHVLGHISLISGVRVTVLKIFIWGRVLS